MTNITRRTFFAASTGLCGLALAGCAVTSSNGTTTVTLNLATVDAYATAIRNAVTTLLSIPAISGALGSATVTAVDAAAGDVATAIGAIDTANAGSTSLTFTTTSVPAAITSLQADANTILANVQTAVTSLGSSLASNVVTTFDALQTVVSLLMALVPSSAVSAVKPKMTEAQALAVLGVTK